MLPLVRTTIDIGDELFRQAKKRAAVDGVSFRQVVEAALRSYLAPRVKSASYKLRWGTEKGRLLPGVNLDDRESLFDRMDGR
jgi:Arc/MetJ family transcription regulator